MKLFFVAVIFSFFAFAASTAPLLNIDALGAIPNQYLIVLHKNSTLAIRDSHVTALEKVLSFVDGEKVFAKWSVGNLIGFSAVLSKKSLAAELEHPDISYIENDGIVTAVDEPVTQPSATWGLDRIDQRALPLSGTYTYWDSAGDGVDAYVIDTGIYLAHSEFGGRAIWGTNTVTGEGDVDGNGHGTHVAGTIGGTTYGVAKKTTLIAVKVLSSGGSGTWSGVIQGIDWTTASYQTRGRPAVANMSLGGTATATVDAAVVNSILAGVNYAIAAGNNNGNACLTSPARVLEAITAGASTNADARASFSNYGTCVDVFAPGNLITSAWIGSTTATNTISGTSMASPHVAGAVAVHLGHAPDHGDPSAVQDWINSNATPNVVTNPGTGSPNRLLYSSYSDV